MKNYWCKEFLFITLLGIFALLPFAHVKLVFFGLPLYLPEIAVGVALGIRFFCFLFRYDSSWTSRLFFPDKTVLAGVLLFCCGALISFIDNPFSLTGLGMLKSWFFFPSIASYLIFCEATHPNRRRGFFLAWFIVLFGTALGSLVFLMQGVLTYDGRLSGVYASPNFLAFFIAPGIFLALYLWPFFERTAYRTFLFFGSGIIGTVIFFTHSYGVFLALFLSFLFYYSLRIIFFGWHKKNFFVLSLFVVAFLGILSLEQSGTKWHSLASFDARSSVSSRMMIWQSAKKIILDHPVFGIGPGRFQVVYLEYQQYFPPYLEWAVPEPHNLYIAVFLSTGAIGFLGFCLFIGRFIFLLVQRITNKEEAPDQALLFSSLLLFFLIYGITDTPYFKNDLALSFFLFLALALSSFTARCDTDAYSRDQ